jgi:hypothetical protein
MATTTVPTTMRPGAIELAREYGVERELEAILEKGREIVKGLRALEVDREPSTDMGLPLIVVRAEIDPAYDDDPSHLSWWSWPIDQFGVHKAAQFLVTTVLSRKCHGR